MPARLPHNPGSALSPAPSPTFPQPVFLVPTAMNYDMLLEERSLAAQLAGAAKKSESLAGLTW